MSDAPTQDTPPEATASAPRETVPTAPERPEPPLAAPPMNPYLAGMFLGLALLASFLILGAGFSPSGGLARLAAFLEHRVLPAHVEAGPAFGPWFPAPLSSYMAFMLLGLFSGSLISALAGGRMRILMERGPSAPRIRRLVLALAGGLLAGLAMNLARGDLLDQLLDGGVLLSAGSFVFLACFLAAGFITAWAFRRQWK